MLRHWSPWRAARPVYGRDIMDKANPNVVAVPQIRARPVATPRNPLHRVEKANPNMRVVRSKPIFPFSIATLYAIMRYDPVKGAASGVILAAPTRFGGVFHV